VAGEVINVGKAFALPLQGLLHLVRATGIYEVVLREVPNVRDIAHVGHVPSDRLGGAADEVGGEEGPKVADVGVHVHRRPTAVETEVLLFDWLDGLGLVGEGVVEAEGGG
jgi:hypothetical protein